SVETLHISTPKIQSTRCPSSLELLEISNLRKFDSSTKIIPRTNPNFSPHNRFDISLSTPKYHKSLSDIDHKSTHKRGNGNVSNTNGSKIIHPNSFNGRVRSNGYAYTSDEIMLVKESSSKRIEKYEDEIQFLKSELDKMNQKLISAEERMVQVNISVTPKQFLEQQSLGRICDQSEIISPKDQSSLYHKG
ncbi:unnamed protein product, partial [Meganyctiphanes norvegica]